MGPGERRTTRLHAQAKATFPGTDHGEILRRLPVTWATLAPGIEPPRVTSLKKAPNPHVGRTESTVDCLERMAARADSVPLGYRVCQPKQPVNRES